MLKKEEGMLGLRSYFMGFGATCLILLALLGCEEAKDRNSTLPLLKLATSADAPPFEFHRTSEGKDEIMGFDIDLAHAIAKELGMSLQIYDGDFSSLIPMLHSGRADLAMASLSVTNERSKTVDFSKPYYTAQTVLLVLQGNNFKEDEFGGKRIGVQLGSTHEQFAKILAKNHTGMEVISLNKLAALTEELQSNRIDGILLDKTPAEAYARLSNGRYSIVLLSEGRADYAIAFPKGSSLRTRVNQALDHLKRKGDIQRLIEKWFETRQTTS